MKISLYAMGLAILLGSSFAQVDSIPDIIKISSLENIFHPVHFDHKLHADMTRMGEGCNTCHHHGSEGLYQPCAHCHVAEEKNASMTMPTINGAYHRNCLNCHQSWTTDEVCKTCHVQKKFRFNARKSLDATDVLAYKHDPIPVPDILHFVSPKSTQQPVSFKHKEHVELYRFKCENCHRQANCSSCHDYQPAHEAEIKTLPIHHDPCSQCHDTAAENDCGRCHTSTPTQGFTHATTGFVLKPFHAALECSECHGGSQPIQALDPACTQCHDNFELDEFDHATTGLVLNDDHVEIDCYECHLDDRYDIAPLCEECHDDDLSFPESLPGKRLQRQ